MTHTIDDFSVGDRVRFFRSASQTAGHRDDDCAEGEVASVNRDLATVDVCLLQEGSASPRLLTKRPWELEKVTVKQVEYFRWYVLSDSVPGKRVKTAEYLSREDALARDPTATPVPSSRVVCEVLETDGERNEAMKRPARST